jgi:hypothetical protein
MLPRGCVLQDTHLGMAAKRLSRDGSQWTRGKRNARRFARALVARTGLLAVTAMGVRTHRYRSTRPPFGERRQAIIFFRYPEQASLVLDCIGSQFPGPLCTLSPVICIGHEINRRFAPELIGPQPA